MSVLFGAADHALLLDCRAPSAQRLPLRGAEGYEEWRERERARLRELAVEVAREALRRSEADGQLETALRFARRLADLDPLSEESCRARMRLLARLGRRAQALAAAAQVSARRCAHGVHRPRARRHHRPRGSRARALPRPADHEGR